MPKKLILSCFFLIKAVEKGVPDEFLEENA
jgi:hypothetical protein